MYRRDKFRGASENLRQLKKIVETGKIELVIVYQLNSSGRNNSEFQAVIVRDLQDNTRKLIVNMLLLFVGLKQ